jgi:hypothetical protein
MVSGPGIHLRLGQLLAKPVEQLDDLGTGGGAVCPTDVDVAPGPTGIATPGRPP